MKCKKFDENWFMNKKKQILNRDDSLFKKAQRLTDLYKLALSKRVKLVKDNE